VKDNTPFPFSFFDEEAEEYKNETAPDYFMYGGSIGLVIFGLALLKVLYV